MILTNHLSAQDKNFPNIDEYKKKYPSDTRVICEESCIMNIKVDKEGKPYFIIEDTNKQLILKDNVNDLSKWVSYFAGTDKIVEHKAFTSQLVNGKIQRLKMENIKKMTEIDDVNYFDDTYCMLGYFPAIKSGVLLESYSKYISPESERGHRFYFGSNSPVEVSKFVVNFPANMNLKCQIVGTDTANITKTASQKGKITTYTWTNSNIKSFEYEINTPNFRHFRPHIIVNICDYEDKNGQTKPLMGTVNDYHKWVISKTKDVNFTLPTDAIKMVDSLILDAHNEEQKVKAIFHWVQENIKYIAIEDGKNGFTPRDAEKVYNLRYGDCKDKSCLIVAMLKHTGIKGALTIVGTRSLPYSFSQFPMIGTANHMVAAWLREGKDPVILDGTTRYTGIYETPDFIQGKECLILLPDNQYKLFSIPVMNPIANLNKETITFTLKNKEIIGSCCASLQGSSKVNFLYFIEGKDLQQQQEFIVSALDFNKKAILTNLQVDKPQKAEDAVKFKYDISVSDYCIQSNKKLYINMIFNKLFEDVEIKENRISPFEFDEVMCYEYITELDIPSNYKLALIPENSSFEHPKFNYSIKYNTDGKKLSCTTKIEINFQIIEGKTLTEFRQFIQSLKKSYRYSVALEQM